MELQLKQRIIGAIVIFTLLIIFMPMLIENDSGPKQVNQLLIPPVSNNQHTSSVDVDPEIEAKIELLKQKLEQRLASNKSHSTAPDTPEPNKTKEQASELQLAKKSIKPSVEPTLELSLVQKNAKKPVQTQTQTQIVSKHIQKAKNHNKDNNKVIFNSKSGLNKSEVYAIKVISSKNKQQADKYKNLLLSKGYPAYINYSKSSQEYSVFVGPDLELKYIKELANRIVRETDYSAEIITHNKDWVKAG